MKKQPTSKLKIAGIVFAIIAGGVFVWWTYSQISAPPEFPFEACQGTQCIKGKQMSKQEDCIINERREMICGNYILTIDQKVSVSVQQ